jgi:sulfonate transport system permease protein
VTPAASGVAGASMASRAIGFLRRHPLLITALVVCGAWEILGRAGAFGPGALPPLSRVLLQLWRDRGVYPINLEATLKEAVVGFVIGNAVAILLAMLFVEAPLIEVAATGAVVALFSMPIIAAAPVLATAFSIDTAKVALASIAVFFPTLINTVVGLRAVDRSLIDTITAIGGNRWTVFRKARLRAALPGVLVGLQIAAPAALLGAILGEFLGGDKGMGVFMMNSMAQFETARTWGAGLVSTLIAALVFWFFGLIGRRSARQAALPTIGVGARSRGGGGNPGWSRALRAVGRVSLGFAVTIGLWYAFIFAFHLSPVVAKTPLDIVKFFTSGPQAAANRHLIATELAQSLPLAGIGLVSGLTAAYVGALLFIVRPNVERTAMPFLLVLQSVPLAAMAPLLVILLGRGALTTIVISLFVTFFASLVTITQGLRSAPSGARELLTVYNASTWTMLTKVQVPHAVPYVFAAARLAAPRALLGVMIAEWLATGRGLGYALVNARFLLQFDVVWATAVVATVFALLAYLAMALLETVATRKYAPQHFTGD